ncbi:MAG: tetratricopeptide repeat protein, partial [Acidobacteriota bacterium]
PAPEPEAPETVEDDLPEIEIDEAEIEHERNEVMEAYLQHRRQDALDLLGLSETAPVSQIERKYIEFSRRFAPWKFEAPGLGNLVEKAEELFLAGGRAFGELTDSERRNTLIHRRRTLREEARKKPDPDRFAIKSQLLDPEVQFAKGTALMQAGNFHDAVQQLQFACDCDPQNSNYRSELAYCRFQLAPGREAEQSLDELREALRIDPKCGMAVYYTGMILGDVGRYDEAEDHLRRSIRLLMPDRRPIEGLKALQKKRK